MPPFHQPPPLNDVSSRSLVADIYSRFVKVRDSVSKSNDVRPIYRLIEKEQERLSPLPDRDCLYLIREVCSMASEKGLNKKLEIVYPISLYMIEIAFNEEMKELTVFLYDLCCFQHRMNLWNIMREKGKQIVRLEFTCSEGNEMDDAGCLQHYFDDIYRLTSTLCSMATLQEITINSICTDVVLCTLGEYCYNLKYLNVAESTRVTDSGIGTLLNVAVRPTLNAFLRISSNGHANEFDPSQRGTRCPRAYLEHNHLTKTLHSLNILNTGVTGVGVALLLKYVRGLTTLHTKAIGEGLMIEEMQTTAFGANEDAPLPLYRLVFVELFTGTREQLEFLSKTCPDIQKLSIVLKLISPIDLPNLVCLSIESDSPLQQRIDEFYQYLKKSGSILEELFLEFSSELLSINAFRVVKCCPRLRVLCMRFLSIKWNPNKERGEEGAKNEQIHILEDLEYIQLGELVYLDVITHILDQSPNLLKVHIESCHERALLSKINSIKLSEDLTCFFVGYLHMFSSPEEVIALLKLNNNISRIGYLGKCDTKANQQAFKQKYGLSPNAKLKFLDENHCESDCFPTQMEE